MAIGEKFLTKEEFEAWVRNLERRLVSLGSKSGGIFGGGGGQIAPAIKTKVRAYLSSNQLNIPNNTWTIVQLDSVNFDTDSGFNTSTYKYATPRSGYYLVSARVSWANVQPGRYIVSIKDGSDRTIHEDQLSTVSNYVAFSFSDILYFSQGSEVGLYVYQSTGGDTPAVLGGSDRTFLALTFLSD